MTQYDHNYLCYPHLISTTQSQISDDESGKIQYNINSQGFRGPDFNNVGVVALGCSITFGVGVSEQDIWPNILSTELGLNIANVSKPAGSPDTCFRFASYWLPLLKPKYVVYLEPPVGRLEVLKSNLNQNAQGQITANKEATSYEIYNAWIRNSLNNDLNYSKNRLAINQLCNDNNIQFISYTLEDFEWDTINDTGFDNIHPGPVPHREFALKVSDDIAFSQVCSELAKANSKYK